MSAFVDTWAWVGSFDRRDTYHERAKHAVLDCLRNKIRLVTTDYVLCETITLLFRKATIGDKSQVVKDLLAFFNVWEVVIEPVTSPRFAKALDSRFRYEDKPEISFTDLTSMVVMQELGITDILTADRHFEKVNLGFRLVPAGLG